MFFQVLCPLELPNAANNGGQDWLVFLYKIRDMDNQGCLALLAIVLSTVTIRAKGDSIFNAIFTVISKSNFMMNF